MRNDDLFTFTELRIALTAFAIWQELQTTSAYESPVDLVDRFIEETT